MSTFPFAKETNQQLSQLQNNPQHAYLLYGQAGLGKLLAARAFAASQLNQPRLATHTDIAHPNLIFVSPAEGKKTISIAQVRSMAERIWRTSQVSTVPKIVIIESIDAISLEAANAMLKNLEDTPPQTIFLLLADSLNGVLPTIRSRTQLIFFSNPTDEQVISFLTEEHSLTVPEAQKLTRLSHGLPRKAIDLLVSDELQKQELLSAQSQAFVQGSITQRFSIAKTVHEAKIAQEFISELSYAIRQQSGKLDLSEIISSSEADLSDSEAILSEREVAVATLKDEKLVLDTQSDAESWEVSGKSSILKGRNEVNNLELILHSVAQLAANVNARSLLENLALQLKI